MENLNVVWLGELNGKKKKCKKKKQLKRNEKKKKLDVDEENQLVSWWKTSMASLCLDSRCFCWNQELQDWIQELDQEFNLKVECKFKSIHI